MTARLQANVHDDSGQWGTDVREYLMSSLLNTYLEAHTTRWRATAMRLAQCTQRHQKREDCIADVDITSDVNKGCDSVVIPAVETNSFYPSESVPHDMLEIFQLCQSLLQEEHRLYQFGMRLATREWTDDVSDYRLTASQALKRLLERSVLVDITLKETMLSHWRADYLNLTADCIRVYCHAITAHPMLLEKEIHRMIAMVSV